MGCVISISSLSPYPESNSQDQEAVIPVAHIILVPPASTFFCEDGVGPAFVAFSPLLASLESSTIDSIEADDMEAESICLASPPLVGPSTDTALEHCFS